MRRTTYKKIGIIFLIAVIASFVIFYVIGLQTRTSVKISESTENPALVEHQLQVENSVASTSQTIKKEQKQEVENPTINVVFKVENISYSVEIDEGSTAYQTMVELQKQGLTFAGTEYSGIGFYVTEINGLKENKKTRSYWTLYINNKEAMLGVSALILKDKDTIEWKYETRN